MKKYEMEAIEMAKPYEEDEFQRFVDEYGWADWMSDYIEDEDDPTDGELDEINDELRRLFDEAHSPAEKIKKLRAESGFSQASFAELYGIPKRTLENWESGVNTPPEYVLEMLQTKVTGIRIEKEGTGYSLYVNGIHCAWGRLEDIAEMVMDDAEKIEEDPFLYAKECNDFR